MSDLVLALIPTSNKQADLLILTEILYLIPEAADSNLVTKIQSVSNTATPLLQAHVWRLP
jgi:hypothetical protein